MTWWTALCSAAAWLVIHASTQRALGPRSWRLTIPLAALSVITVAAVASMEAGAILAMLLLTFWHVLALVDRSVSVRTLVELRAGALSLSDLGERYDPPGILRRRLAELAVAHLVNRDAAGRHQLTALGTWVAALAAWAQGFLRCAPGG